MPITITTNDNRWKTVKASFGNEQWSLERTLFRETSKVSSSVSVKDGEYWATWTKPIPPEFQSEFAELVSKADQLLSQFDDPATLPAWDAYLHPFYAVKSDFQRIGAAHAAKLPIEQWETLRERAANPSFKFDRELSFIPDAAPEDVFEHALTYDSGPTVNDFLQLGWRYSIIGELAGQPLYYLEDKGVYVWSDRPDNPLTMSVWLTYPSYPKGW